MTAMTGYDFFGLRMAKIRKHAACKEIENLGNTQARWFLRVSGNTHSKACFNLILGPDI